MRRLTLVLMLFATVFTVASCEKEESITVIDDPQASLHCVKPDYLKAGDRVALISPSYYTPMENVEKTADVLRGWGLVPVIGPNVGKVYAGKYAGTVEERVSDIRWALNDTTIKAIICNRGGYGTIQLIDQLPLKEWGAHPKWLVGFSDITTLHGLLTRAGVMSIHGTMSSFLAAGGTDTTSTQNIEGRASGILVGGNICTFAPNLGTQADATLGRDLILFIEEVGESMHNIDRQFNILAMNGVLSRCKGVVLGEFDGCGSELSYESIEAMLRQYIEKYNIPLLCGFPAGHGDVNLPLVMGAPVTIDVRSDGATLQFDIVGQQQAVNTANITAPASSPVTTRMRLAGKLRVEN